MVCWTHHVEVELLLMLLTNVCPDGENISCSIKYCALATIFWVIGVILDNELNHSSIYAATLVNSISLLPWREQLVLRRQLGYRSLVEKSQIVLSSVTLS